MVAASGIPMTGCGIRRTGRDVVRLKSETCAAVGNLIL